MKFILQINFLFLFVLISSCSQDSVPTTVEKNNPPKITSLTSQSDIVDGLTSVQLVCLASDPDGDNLEYIWEYAKGKLDGTGSVVYWTAPNSVGDYEIICTVDDSKGGVVKDTVNIRVGQLSILPLEITDFRIVNQGKIDIGSIVDIISETNKIASDDIKYGWGVYGGSFNTVLLNENNLKITPSEEKAYVITNVVKNSKNEIDFESASFFVGDTIPGNNAVKIMQFIPSKNSYTISDTISLNFYAVTLDNSPITYEINVTGYGVSARFAISGGFDNAIKPFVVSDLGRFVNEDRYDLIFTCCAFDDKKNSDVMIIKSVLTR